MTESMVEKIARAIWNIRRDEEDRCDMELEDMGEDHPVWAEARAALQAMRDPDDDMWAAAWLVYHPWGVNAPDPRDRPNAFDAMKEKTNALLSAMIDAALKENAD